MDKCSICGSDRMFGVDPAHDPDYFRCLDCGSVFNQPVMREPTPAQVSVAISEEIQFPEGGFSTPEEAAQHLAKLKEAAKRLGKPTVGKENNFTKKKVHPTSDYPNELVMAELHYFQRKGEGFQEVVSTAK